MEGELREFASAAETDPSARDELDNLLLKYHDVFKEFNRRDELEDGQQLSGCVWRGNAICSVA